MGYSDQQAQKRYQVQWIRNRRERYIEDHGPCELCLSADGLGVCRKDSFVVVRGNTWGLSDKRRAKVLKQCRILCAECRKDLKRKTRIIQHGTATAYKEDGCRCELCRNNIAAKRKSQPSRQPGYKRTTAD